MSIEMIETKGTTNIEEVHYCPEMPVLHIYTPEPLRTKEEAEAYMSTLVVEYPDFMLDARHNNQRNEYLIHIGDIKTRKQYSLLPNLLRRVVKMNGTINLVYCYSRLGCNDSEWRTHQYDTLEFWRVLALAQMRYSKDAK